jgi:hypothetical protein
MKSRELRKGLLLRLIHERRGARLRWRPSHEMVLAS